MMGLLREPCPSLGGAGHELGYKVVMSSCGDDISVDTVIANGIDYGSKD